VAPELDQRIHADSPESNVNSTDMARVSLNFTNKW
jgi:hypothetical protein